MSWATSYIEKLRRGETVQFRPKGPSMAGKVESGQLVTVVPCSQHGETLVGDIVLCKVNGVQYLHLVKAIGSDGRFQIGNNLGKINGWCSKDCVFGVVIRVED